MNQDDKAQVLKKLSGMTLRAAQLLTPSWSDDDFRSLSTVCARNRIDPFDLLAVFTSESGLDPTARNPRSKYEWPVAVGLNQITRVAAASAGLIPNEKVPGDKTNLADWKKLADQIVSMSVKDQLPLIDNYYAAAKWTKAGKPWTSGAKIYAYNAAAGTDLRDIDDGSLIFPVGSVEYAGNAGLDLDGKGGITGRDLRLQLEQMRDRPVYQAAFLRLGRDGLRTGYGQGYADGQNRYPLNVNNSGYADADLYAVGYSLGFGDGSRAPHGTPIRYPASLV